MYRSTWGVVSSGKALVPGPANSVDVRACGLRLRAFEMFLTQKWGNCASTWPAKLERTSSPIADRTGSVFGRCPATLWIPT